MNLNYLKELDKLVDDGWLSKSEMDNLVLYNYTDKTTFAKHWNTFTINARGTIYDKNTGKVVALAFPKFFNHNEALAPKDEPGGFSPMVKMDGSLGTGFFRDGQWCVATRGSFYSDQAKEATKMLREQYDMKRWPKEYTPLFEIIYPENRIIVDYGDKRELVLLAARHTQYGIYMPQSDLDVLASYCGFETTTNHKQHSENFESIKQVEEHVSKLSWQEEGYVLRFHQSGNMVKVKSPEYLRVAKAKSDLTLLNIWEWMCRGDYQEMVTKMPDELHEEAKVLARQIEDAFIRTAMEVNLLHTELAIPEFPKESEMKAIAKKILEEGGKYQGVLFAMARNSPKVTELIFKHIRPTGNVLST